MQWLCGMCVSSFISQLPATLDFRQWLSSDNQSTFTSLSPLSPYPHPHPCYLPGSSWPEGRKELPSVFASPSVFHHDCQKPGKSVSLVQILSSGPGWFRLHRVSHWLSRPDDSKILWTYPSHLPTPQAGSWVRSCRLGPHHLGVEGPDGGAAYKEL